MDEIDFKPPYPPAAAWTSVGLKARTAWRKEVWHATRLAAAETTNRHQEALILILADIHSSGAGSPAAW